MKNVGGLEDLEILNLEIERVILSSASVCISGRIAV